MQRSASYDPLNDGVGSVLTVSDRASSGAYVDRSGPAIVECVKGMQFHQGMRLVRGNAMVEFRVTETVVVPDERMDIERALSRMCDGG